MVDETRMPTEPSSDLESVTRREFRTAQEEFRAAMKRIDELFLAKEEFHVTMRGVDRRFTQLEVKIEDVKNHAGVLHEDLVHRFELVFEYLAPFSEKVANHEERLVAVENDVILFKDRLKKPSSAGR